MLSSFADSDETPGQSDAMHGPLAGVRVLDLTSVVVGPYATQVLGDFGADVIKVESTDGDIMRHAGPMRSPGMGHVFLNANRNKRSIVLDLKRPAGHEALLALAARSDVLVYNIRPRAMARLRLSYEDVREANPRIIYAGPFGYNQRGPYASRAAYDDLIQGASGIPWLLHAAGAEGPRYVPANLGDRTAALHLVNAVCAVLPGKNGQGATRGRAHVRKPVAAGVGRTLGWTHLRAASRRPGVRADARQEPQALRDA